MKNTGNSGMVFPLAMAVLFSIVFGSAMHDWTLGVCMGVCMGAAFGLFGRDKEAPPAAGETEREAAKKDAGDTHEGEKAYAEH